MENCYERELGGDLYRLMRHDRDKTPPQPCHSCPPLPMPPPLPPKPLSVCPPPKKKGGISGLFGNLCKEDIVLLGVIVLLLSEHADWDIVVILGILYILK